jgi:hypothetical protein
MGLGYSKPFYLIAGTTERSAAVRQIADHYPETVNGFASSSWTHRTNPEATWLSDCSSPTSTARW